MNQLQSSEHFIRNILDVEVDGLRHRNRYIVRAMVDVIQADGFAKMEQKVIEDVTLTWDEIEKEGGVSEVKKQFKERYNLQKGWGG
ncbi:hypothetical protein [Paenibacillus sp. BAC0078]